MENQLEKRRKLDASIATQQGADRMEHEKISELQEKASELQEKVSELEKKLLQKEDQVKAHAAMISKLENSLKVAERKAAELEAVEKAFLKKLEDYAEPRGDCGIVGPKQIGFFNIEEGWFTNDLNIGDEFMTFWEARVKDPDFDASICVDDGEGNMKYVIREDHEELNQLRKSHGDVVYEAVCNVYLQVMEWGAEETVLWNYGQNTKASAMDVIYNCTVKISPWN